MLNKEECEQALMNICSSNSKVEDRKIFKDLINEHFELVEKYEMLSNTYSMLCEDYLNPQPYKFEDLKKGMLVWDNQLKWCFEIAICKVEIKGYENLKMFKVKNYDDSLTLMIFEKNRFYPVQMANVRCE